MARLFRRGRVWHAWIGQPGGGTVRVSTHCADKKAAAKRADELERGALDPAHAAASKADTVAACTEFLSSRLRRGRADGTIHHYRVKLGHIVRLMPKRLGDIDASACERFIEQRLSEGTAPTTVKKEIRALGATLRHAKRQGLYSRDIEAVIPDLAETYKPRERFLMPLEFVALVGALPPGRAAQVVFIVATGARWGEAERAQREDVDDHMVRMRGTKTKLARGTVPVPPPLRVALQWALLHAPGDEGQSLFARWGNVRRDLLQACEAIGIAPVTPNDLRRTFATWLSQAGMTADLVGKAMRHTTGRMAETVYGRIKPADLDRLITERSPALGLEHSTPTAQAPMKHDTKAVVHGASTRIENPRVGSSILSLGTEKAGEKPSGAVSEVAPDTVESATSQHISSTVDLAEFRARSHRWLTRGVA